jgi:hypothetical protein
MATGFVNIDRQTATLLPPDLKEWVAENARAKFILEAVEVTGTAQAAVSVRGGGSEPYPPAMMLAVSIYCYATGTDDEVVVDEKSIPEGITFIRRV